MLAIIKNIRRKVLRLRVQKHNIILQSERFNLPKTSFLETDKGSKILFKGYFNIGNYVILNLSDNAYVEIGENVFIGDYSTIRATRTSVTIGRDTLIAQNVKLVAMNHAFMRKDQLIKEQDLDLDKMGIVIGEDCWVGAGAVILPGVTLGRGVVVGANAVVTKNVPDYAIVAGNPARILKYRE